MSLARGGLVGGIGRTLREAGHLVGGLRREEEQKKIEEEERRRRQQRDDLDIDLRLAELGGGRGPGPTESFTPNPGQGFRSAAEDFDPEPLLPQPERNQPVGADDFMPVPEFDRPDPVELERTPPGVRQLAGGEFHIEDPDFRARRREDEETDRRVAGIGGALTGLGVDEERAPHAARGLVEGVPGSVIFPETREQPDVNWQTVTDAQGQMHQVHPRTGETREIPLTGRVPGTGTGTSESVLERQIHMERVRSANRLMEQVAGLDPNNEFDRQEIDAIVARSPFASLDEARSVEREGLGFDPLPPPEPTPEPEPEPERDGGGFGAAVGRAIGGIGSFLTGRGGPMDPAAPRDEPGDTGPPEPIDAPEAEMVDFELPPFDEAPPRVGPASPAADPGRPQAEMDQIRREFEQMDLDRMSTEEHVDFMRHAPEDVRGLYLDMLPPEVRPAVQDALGAHMAPVTAPAPDAGGAGMDLSPQDMEAARAEWDRLAEEFGEERVRSEIGPRP